MPEAAVIGRPNAGKPFLMKEDAYMKYQALKKKQRENQLLLLFLVVPLLVIFAALPLIFSEDGFNAETLLWVIPMGLLAVAMCAYSFQIPKNLKRLCQRAGAASDAEMDAILDSAEDFSGKMFVTEQYCINTNSLSIYPVSDIRTLYPMIDLKRKGRNTYSVRITYGEKGIDDVHFHNARKRDALVQYLLDKSQGRIELIRY